MSKGKFPVLFRQDGATDEFFIVFPCIGTCVASEIISFNGDSTNIINEDQSFVLAGKLETTYHCDINGNLTNGYGRSTSYSVIPFLLSLDFIKNSMWALEPYDLSGHEVDDMENEATMPQKVLTAGILKLLTTSGAKHSGIPWAHTYEANYLSGPKISLKSNFSKAQLKFLQTSPSTFNSTLKIWGLPPGSSGSPALHMAEDFI